MESEFSENNMMKDKNGTIHMNVLNDEIEQNTLF